MSLFVACFSSGASSFLIVHVVLHRELIDCFVAYSARPFPDSVAPRSIPAPSLFLCPVEGAEEASQLAIVLPALNENTHQ